MSNLTVAVLGPGGVGGFLAAVFCRNGFDVACIARPSTASWIAQHGLVLESPRFGNFTVYPGASTTLEKPVDLLFITTKAVHLPDALKRLQSVDLSATVIVPLLNGIEHVDFLRERIVATIVPGSIRISARVVQPGTISHLSDFAIVSLACDDPAVQGRVRTVAQCLERCGVQAILAQGERQVLWEKLVRLNALACTTAASDQPIGWIRNDPEWRKTLQAVVEEGARVAQAEGVAIDPAKEMSILDALPAALTSSMRDDLAAHRPSELDAIAGAVVRAGAKYGLPCPTTEDLFNAILKRVKENENDAQ